MIESDTIKLLRECDAGIKMGVTSIDEVLDYVHDEELGKTLRKCRDEHNELKGEILTLLGQYHDDGKEPNPIAKGMSWVKTNAKLAMDESDPHDSRSDDGRLQYGSEIPEPLSEPVPGGR